MRKEVSFLGKGHSTPSTVPLKEAKDPDVKKRMQFIRKAIQSADSRQVALAEKKDAKVKGITSGSLVQTSSTII